MGTACFEVVGGTARFRLAGGYTMEDGVRQITDAIVRTRESGFDKLLVDILAITGVEPPSVDARYWIVGEWAKAGRSDVRVALVAPAELLDPDRIGTIIGRNAGFICKAFETGPEALAWLHGPGAPGPADGQSMP